MWFLFGEVRHPLNAWDGLRYFIVAFPGPSIYLFSIDFVPRLIELDS